MFGLALSSVWALKLIYHKGKTMKEIQNDELMTIEQLEKELGLSRNLQAKLRMEKHRGTPNFLPHYKVCKKIFYKRSEIAQWFGKFKVA